MALDTDLAQKIRMKLSGTTTSGAQPNNSILSSVQKVTGAGRQAFPSFSFSSFDTRVSQSTPSVATGPDTLDLLKAFAQGLGRSYLAGGETIRAKLADPTLSLSEAGKSEFKQEQGTTFGAITQAISGTSEPVSLLREDINFLGEKWGTRTGGAVTGVFLGLDLLGGGGVKGILGLSKAVRTAETAIEVGRLMKQAGFADDIIELYSPILAIEKNTNKVKEGLISAEKLQNTTVLASGARTAKEIYIGKTNNKIIKDIIIQNADELLETTGKYKFQSQKEVRNFIQNQLGKERHSNVFNAPFRIDELSETHFLDTGSASRITQKVRFFGEGLEIVEDKGLLVAIDSTSDDGIVYFDVLGKSTEGDNLIVRAKVTEKEKDGKVYFSVSSIKSGGTDTPATPSSDRRHVGFTTSDSGTSIVSSTPKPVKDDITEGQFLAQGQNRELGNNRDVPIQTSPTQAGKEVQKGRGQSHQAKQATQENVSRAYKEQYTGGNGKVNNLDTALKNAETTTNEPTLFQRIANGLKETQTKIIEVVQDTDIRIKQLQKNARLTDESDVYLRMTLMPGRLEAKVRETRKIVEGIFSNLQKTAKVNGKDFKAIRAEANEYLRSRHAPERNTALGDGAAGITTKAANEKLVALKRLSYFNEIEQAATQLTKLNEETLDMLLDAQVISEDLYSTLRTKYKHHVPLNRIFEESEDVGSVLSGGGLDVRSTGIKKAKGSQREVDDIVGNIVLNYEQAAIRAEKNIVDLASLRFVRENPSPLFKVKYPRVVGESFEVDGKKIPILETTRDPHILQMYEKGKRVWIEINDSNLAVAFRGVGREHLPRILEPVRVFTRIIAGLATRFNPEFALSNKIRDLQEVVVYLSSQKSVGAKGAVGVVTRDPQSMVAITNWIRGVDSEGARLYAEMRRHGGTTGGLGLSTRSQIDLDIRKLEKLATSNPRKYAEKLAQYVDDWNMVFEDSTRLSVYRQALSQGLSKDRAAFLAKEASVNFNRMGRGGPVVNALWMFSNASIQGSMKMIRALKDPKVLIGTTAVVGGSVTAVNQWNDSVDENWRNNVSKWDRLNSLTIALPSEEGTVRYLNIPVSWGLKPLKVMADYAYDTATGRELNVASAFEDLFTSIAEAYNPIGGTDWVSAATPTILDIPIELARNMKWSGSRIRNDIDPYAPASIQYFDSLEEKATGRLAISTTEKLSGYGIEISPADIVYGIEQYTSGAGRSASRFANLIWGFASNDLPPVSEFPFVSRFYRERSEDEVFNTEANEAIRALFSEDRKERFYLRKKAEDEVESLKDLSPEEMRAKLRAVAGSNPELAEKMIDILEADKLNLKGTDRQLKTATVDIRAHFILKEIEDKTKDEKKALLKEYARKGIVTEAVLEKMVELKEQ